MNYPSAGSGEFIPKEIKLEDTVRSRYAGWLENEDLRVYTVPYGTVWFSGCNFLPISNP
jgi:hypothetical protein